MNVRAALAGRRVWLVGCGNMGGGMLHRWIESRALFVDQVVVIDPGAPVVPTGVAVHPNMVALVTTPDILVLAVKPQQLDAVADVLLSQMPARPALLVSIMAGVEQATLQARFGAESTVRAMPNLPVAIGKGVIGLYGSARDGELGRLAEALMAPLGLVEWINDEALFDVVTALSGSGPGFTYRFIDALAAAGAALGLPVEQAARFATATVEGSALLAAASSDSPAKLADHVASPGGSTRKGLDVLDRDDVLVRLLTATLDAATRRNREMADAARGRQAARG